MFGRKTSAIVCIAKLENLYIREWVEYHLHLGVDHIYIYDNNDVDGERITDPISDWIAAGKVTVVDYRGRKVAQMEAYNDCYRRFKEKWLAFIDCDEFITFTPYGEKRYGKINSYLKRIFLYNSLRLNWLCYGDGGMISRVDAGVVERFVESLPTEDIVNTHLKSIVRRSIPYLRWSSQPHIPDKGWLRVCDEGRHRMPKLQLFRTPTYKILYIRHYLTKTLEEYIDQKMKRQAADQPGIVYTLDHFFACNKVTSEKLAYLEMRLGIDVADRYRDRVVTD